MLLLSIVLSVLAVLISLLLRWYYLKYKFYDTGVGVKYTGLKMYPLIGNIFTTIGICDSFEMLNILTKYSYEHSGKMLLQVGFLYSVFVTDYKLIEFVMNSTTITKKAEVYGFLNKWLGTGLLLSYGEKWRKRRKMITPAFHYQILESQIEVFHRAGDTLVDEISKNIDNNMNPLDAHSFISLCTLDIICETAMGVKIHAQTMKDSKYVGTVREISKIFLDRIILPWNFYDALYVFSSTYRREKRCIAYLHKHTNDVIKSRRRELMVSRKASIDQNADECGLKTRYAFLDILLRSTIDEQPLNDEDIREEVDTFMFEGHDTTASAISFAVFNIAKYPDVQTKLLQEQMLIFGGNRSRPATFAELNGMKYLEMVIKETLRLYPSVPAFGREVSEEFEFDGVKFKKGLQIGLYIFGFHRNPEYFPEPEKFIPERFSTENNVALKPYAYVPFSAGPRNCIGQKFAMLEMKSTISKIIRFFEMHAVVPEHTLKMVPETILKSINGFPIIFKHRNFNE